MDLLEIKLGHKPRSALYLFGILFGIPVTALRRIYALGREVAVYLRKLYAIFLQLMVSVSAFPHNDCCVIDVCIEIIEVAGGL